jgi:FlaG/FlaF family flagellin (archaellin)
MKAVLHDDESGVSEVIGTIMILGITVVLFSTIILWVTSIPTPTTQSRLDMESTLNPVYNSGGTEIGVNVTIRHLGGDKLLALPTRIYVTSQSGSGPLRTDIVTLRPYNGLLATPSGLVDGTDSNWDAGERWAYKNFSLRSTDSISVTIVDISKSVVQWSSAINATSGARPPIFVQKWVDGNPATSGIDPVVEHLGFAVYAQVIDPDGDLNTNSVFATFSAWFGTGNVCEAPQQMRDDGVTPDRVASDGIFTLANTCTNAPFPNLNWDQSIILFNATDKKGNTATSRIVLSVQPGAGGPSSGGSTLWPYVGFAQVVWNGFWVTNLNNAYNTAITYSPYRITKAQLVNTGGPMFHLKMSNHGNRTLFLDGYSALAFTRTTGAAEPPSVFITKILDPTKPANSGGTAAYPGVAGSQTTFAYASVLDINPANPDGGGLPSEIYLASASPFTSVTLPTQPALTSANTNPGTYIVHIVVSGIVGPNTMTYGQIITRWGAAYNPWDHLGDADLTTRTYWYSQLIEYASITIF